MAGHTRLDCCIGSSSLMRQAVAQAVHHARHRTAFQKKLIDQPLMTNVLADLALECEAATVLTMRLARAYDENDETAQVFRRVVTPAAKFWICKRAPCGDAGGDGGAGRLRLHRGKHHAAALSRGAGQFDLGRLGQRDVPRRAARHRAHAEGSATCCAPNSRTPAMRG